MFERYMRPARNHAPVSRICFSTHMNFGTNIGCPRRG